MDCFLVKSFLLNKKSSVAGLLDAAAACYMVRITGELIALVQMLMSQLVISLQNHVNPAMDFTQTPPGMLALDNMLYFAKHHQDAYIRVRLLLIFEVCAVACLE